MTSAAASSWGAAVCRPLQATPAADNHLLRERAAAVQHLGYPRARPENSRQRGRRQTELVEPKPDRLDWIRGRDRKPLLLVRLHQSGENFQARLVMAAGLGVHQR